MKKKKTVSINEKQIKRKKSKGKDKYFAELKSIANKKGGACISSFYVNAKEKLKFKCDKDHVWLTTPSAIKQGSWCPVCAKNRYSHTLEELKEIAAKRGGKLLSEEYLGIKGKMEWQCNLGHVWFSSFESINRGHWCKSCSKSLGERVTRKIFELVFNDSFPQKSFSIEEGERKKRKIVLDGYSDNSKVGFNYSPMLKKKTPGFQATYVANYEIPCSNRGITLIIIKEQLDINQLDQFISHVCLKIKTEAKIEIKKEIKLNEKDIYVAE